MKEAIQAAFEECKNYETICYAVEKGSNLCVLSKLEGRISAQVISSIPVLGSQRNSGDVFLLATLDNLKLASAKDFERFRVTIPRDNDQVGIGPKIKIE